MHIAKLHECIYPKTYTKSWCIHATFATGCIDNSRDIRSNINDYICYIAATFATDRSWDICIRIYITIFATDTRGLSMLSYITIFAALLHLLQTLEESLCFRI